MKEAAAAKENGLVLSANEGLVMVTAPTEALERLKQLQNFVAAVMVDGVDYGVIPGTDKGDDGKKKARKSLLQPGAQKLEEVYGLNHTFEIEKTEDWQRPFFNYQVRCVLRRGDRYVGDGVGSCNSLEARYGYRWVWPNDVPPDVEKATLRVRVWKSKGREFTKYRLMNEDVFSLTNTMLKMACKRSLVHAVIGVTRSSGIFTQDVEDLPPEQRGQHVVEGVFDDDDQGPPPEEERLPTAAEFVALFDKAETRQDLEELGKRANGVKDGREAMMEAFKKNRERLPWPAGTGAAKKGGASAPKGA